MPYGTLQPYEREIVIDENTKRINVCPEKTVYWYGNKIYEGTTISVVGVKANGDAQLIEYDDHFYHKSWGVNSSGHYESWYFIAPNVDFEFSKASARMSWTRGGTQYWWVTLTEKESAARPDGNWTIISNGTPFYGYGHTGGSGGTYELFSLDYTDKARSCPDNSFRVADGGYSLGNMGTYTYYEENVYEIYAD